MKLKNFNIFQSQQDPRWGEDEIKSGVKLKDYGCLVTDISVVANFYGMDETPDEVVDKINAKGGFTSDGSYYWGKAE